MLTPHITLIPQSQPNHWKSPIAGRGDEDLARQTENLIKEVTKQFQGKPFVFTMNGSALKDPQDLTCSCHIYTFSNRNEKLEFFRKCLGVKKDSHIMKLGVCGILELACRSLYVHDRKTLIALIKLQQTIEAYKTPELDVRTPEKTYLSHVVVVPNDENMPLSHLVRETFNLGNKISSEIFGAPGHFSITYNSPEIRSVPDRQHIHLDFFKTREDRRKQLALALRRY